MAIGEDRVFKRGMLLRRENDHKEVVTYIGPPNGPWEDFEGWGIVEYPKSHFTKLFGRRFNVDLNDFEIIGDLTDALAGLA